MEGNQESFIGSRSCRRRKVKVRGLVCGLGNLDQFFGETEDDGEEIMEKAFLWYGWVFNGIDFP
ncbi:uncharacterized protein DS421_19g644070 [Arachis hypogaea]|uniref:Uncharacterized protein n=1 Tax=Arachis hypogaea TaxID=3818 RepID=A0A6B9V4S2_ARAHY|nr:uncharacterized protein DS421_19g644070 [Arachis hypogaea]